MSMKVYYRVSAANGHLGIRPLNSEKEVKRAIEQSSIIAKHVRDNIVSFFVLERKVDVSNFYAWLSQADQYCNLALERPSYVENDPVTYRTSSSVLVAPPPF